MATPVDSSPDGSTGRAATHHRPSLPYIPALDGLRGVAVAAVLLFHGGYAWAKGGHLGVSVFFTLSGFLITSLLVAERDSTGRVALGAFWARRARRLVPAIVVTFGLIAAVIPHLEARPDGLVGDSIASSWWFANWHFIFAERGYADLFSSPSPFQHFWSLAVEEQFYVLFPLLVVAVLGVRRRLTPLRVGVLALVLGGLTAGSVLALGAHHSPIEPIARAYYGTDARAAELLVGALLALAVRRHLHGPRPTWMSTAAANLIGLAGAAGLVHSFLHLGERDARLYEGGLLVIALCSAAVIFSSLHHRSLIGQLLSTGPLVALGKISYGAYLFHWPLYLAITERSTGLTGLDLAVVRIGATLTLAAVSFVLIEAPIRHGRALPTLVARPAWGASAVAGIAVVALVSGELSPPRAHLGDEVVAAGQAPPAEPANVGGGAEAQSQAQESARSRSVEATAEGQPTGPVDVPTDERLPAALFEDADESTVRPVPDVPPGALRVAVVGDSLAFNLGGGLETWADEQGDVVVYNVAISACPISREGTRRFGPDGDPWPISSKCGWWDRYGDRREAVQRFDPDVVVFQDGVTEMVDRWLPEWGDYLRPGHPRFDAWLRDEYTSAVEALGTSYDTSFVVTNAACGDWGRYSAFRDMRDIETRIAALNTNVYPLLQGVTVADLFQRICPGGQYQDEVEGVENGRPDGIHLSDEAAAALARNWLGPIILEARTASPALP